MAVVPSIRIRRCPQARIPIVATAAVFYLDAEETSAVRGTVNREAVVPKFSVCAVAIVRADVAVLDYSFPTHLLILPRRPRPQFQSCLMTNGLVCVAAVALGNGSSFRCCCGSYCCFSQQIYLYHCYCSY